MCACECVLAYVYIAAYCYSFTLYLEFRTFYDDGLLVYVTNEDKTDFVAVQLLGGRLETVYKDNTLVSGRRLGDGLWHQVQKHNAVIGHDSVASGTKT